MPLSDLIHPHDHFFRDVFSRPDAAADFLRYYLPPAVAAVLDSDHGRARWTVPTRFEALLPAPVALQGYVPTFEYTLIDLSTWRDEDLRGQVILQVALRLFKHIFQPDLRQQLPAILGLLRDLLQQRTGLAYLYTVLRYLSQATDRLTPDDLRQVVNQTLSSRGDNLMPTIAEQWVMEGQALYS